MISRVNKSLEKKNDALELTWNLRMSRGLPAFFRQFWLHFRKNLRKNLKKEGGENSVLLVVINGQACATRLFLTQIMFKRIFAATDYSASFDNCFKEFKKFNFEDVMMITVEKKSYWHRSLNKIGFYDLHLSST